MPKTTVEWFEENFGEVDDYLNQYEEEMTIQEAAIDSYRKFTNEYYEELAEESDIFEIYRQEEDEGII